MSNGQERIAERRKDIDNYNYLYYLDTQPVSSDRQFTA